jgi:hypothetical protein
LASEQQVGEIIAGNGQPIVGAGTVKALRVAGDLANRYGGVATDWSKVASSHYTPAGGYPGFEVHAYQNKILGIIVEFKTKFE